MAFADPGDTLIKKETTDPKEMTQKPHNIAASAGPADSAVVSKRFLKRLAKKAKWEEKKKIIRAKTRLKKKEMKANGRTTFSRKLLKSKTMRTSSCKINIVVDLSFDDLMIEKDIAKCVGQVHRCYSINRRLTNPVQLHITSFVGESAKEMEKHDGFGNWDMYFHKESYDSLFPKESIVYLTSESENVVDKLEEGRHYIIGGLVDHNSKKGHCHQLAIEKGLSHARLPIDEFLEMKTRKILSIDHVFEIMANVCQGVSWQDAFLKVIPPRKQVVLKDAAKEIEETSD